MAVPCFPAEPERALAAATECVELVRAGAGDGILGMALGEAATLHARLGNPDAALTALGAAARWARDGGNKGMVSAALSFSVLTMADLAEPYVSVVLAGALTKFGVSAEAFAHASLLAAKVDQARLEIGAEVFDAALARGAAMTHDETVPYLLGEIDRLIDESADASERPRSNE